MKKIILIGLSVIFLFSCSKEEKQETKNTSNIFNFKPLREIAKNFNDNTDGGRLLLQLTELPAMNNWQWKLESINTNQAKLFTKNKGVCLDAFLYPHSNAIFIVSHEGFPGQLNERNARIIQAAELLLDAYSAPDFKISKQDWHQKLMKHICQYCNNQTLGIFHENPLSGESNTGLNLLDEGIIKLLFLRKKGDI